jgi:hypothetical protein
LRLQSDTLTEITDDLLFEAVTALVAYEETSRVVGKIKTGYSLLAGAPPSVRPGISRVGPFYKIELK